MTFEEFKAAIVGRGYPEQTATDWLETTKMERDLGLEPETMEQFIDSLGYLDSYPCCEGCEE